MTDLLKVGDTLNSNGTITSLELLEQINMFREQEMNRAELAHSDLLKVIRDEFEEEIGVGNISESYYLNSQNKNQPMFRLTLNQAKQVLVRESKFVRKAVIAYIDKLESCIKHLLPQTFSEALQLAANQAKEIEEKNSLLLEQAPKVEFFDAVADSKDAVPMIDVAKVLGIKGMGRNNLFEFLRENKVLMNNNQPFQKHIDSGYFRVIEQRYQKNGEECINFKTLAYQKGIQYIKKLLNEK